MLQKKNDRNLLFKIFFYLSKLQIQILHPKGENCYYIARISVCHANEESSTNWNRQKMREKTKIVSLNCQLEESLGEFVWWGKKWEMEDSECSFDDKD